jgi:hypothetical protein
MLRQWLKVIMEIEIKYLIDQSVSIFNVVGPFIIYIPQYLLMGKNKTVGSFSCLICYIMLTAHILRLIFHQMITFHISLYIQSYFMLLIHSALLFQYLRISHYQKSNQKLSIESSESSDCTKNELELMDCENQTGHVNHAELKANKEEDCSDTEFEIRKDSITKNLMNQEDKNKQLLDEAISTDVDTKESSKDDTDYMLKGSAYNGEKKELEADQKSNLELYKSTSKYKRSFINIILGYFIFGVIYFSIFKFINARWFADITALFSCLCESLLPVPQFIANCRMKSFESLSFFMVFCWLFGDVMKFFFLLDEGQPLQFIIGTANIILFDSLIVIQYFLYKKKTKGKFRPNKELSNVSA